MSDIPKYLLMINDGQPILAGYWREELLLIDHKRATREGLMPRIFRRDGGYAVSWVEVTEDTVMETLSARNITLTPAY